MMRPATPKIPRLAPGGLYEEAIPRLAPRGLYEESIPRLAPGGFYEARLRIASAAAATVASMSASVWAAEKKSASYWLHGM